MKEASEFDMELSPPEMGQIIHRIIREESGHPDPYREIKMRSTDCALELSEEALEQIEQSDNPFAVAVRFAIAGNIMDYALLSMWSKNKIDESFTDAAEHAIDMQMVSKLAIELAKAKTVLVLADNAGEAVFDRIMIQQFPGNAEVIYAVKALPIINDATMQEAKESGLEEVATIIDNGTDAPGTLLHKCSESFKAVYEKADVVIAKGQANFETLNQADRNIYYLTQIKCPVIAERYGYQVGDWIVTNTEALAEREANR